MGWGGHLLECGHVSVGGMLTSVMGWQGWASGEQVDRIRCSREHGVGWASWGEGGQLLRERQCQPLRGHPACTTGPPFALPPASGLTMQRASWTRRAAWSDAGYPITNSVLKHVPPTGHLAALGRILPSQASVPLPPTSVGDGELRWPTRAATCPVVPHGAKPVGRCRSAGQNAR